jgi:hypothetical protein
MTVSFLLGVISSIVASIIVLTVGWAVSVNTRRWIAQLLGRFTGFGLFALFARQADASSELVGAVGDARWVWIYAARGNELVSGTLDSLWDRVSTIEEVRIVLPDPQQTDSRSWLTHHEEEAAKYDPGFGSNLLSRQVQSNIEYLRERTKLFANVQVRTAEFPTVARIVLTDRASFLTLYSSAKHGRDAPCVVARSPSPLYDFSHRLFLMTWRATSTKVSYGDNLHT